MSLHLDEDLLSSSLPAAQPFYSPPSPAPVINAPGDIGSTTSAERASDQIGSVSKESQYPAKNEARPFEKSNIAPSNGVDVDMGVHLTDDDQTSLEHVARDPASWTLYTSLEGYPYYYNHKTGQSVWASYEESGQVSYEYYSNTAQVDDSHNTEQRSPRAPGRTPGGQIEGDESDDNNGESGRLVDDERYAIPGGLVFDDSVELFAGEGGVTDDADDYRDDKGGMDESAETEDDVDEEAFLAYLNSPEGQLALEEEKRLIEEQASLLLKQRLKEGMKTSDSSAWGQMKRKDDSQHFQGYDERNTYPSSGYSSQRRGGLDGSEDLNIHRRHTYAMPPPPPRPVSAGPHPTPYLEHDQSDYQNESLSPSHEEYGRNRRHASGRRSHRRRGGVDLEGGRVPSQTARSHYTNTDRNNYNYNDSSSIDGDDKNDADLSSSDSDVEEIIAPTIPDIPAGQVLSTVLAPVQTILGQLLGAGTYYTQQLLRRISTDGAINVGTLSQQAIDVSSHVIDKSIEIFQHYGVPIYSSINESVVRFIESNLSDAYSSSASPSTELPASAVSLAVVVPSEAVSVPVSSSSSLSPYSRLDLPGEAAPSYIVGDVNAALLGDNDTMINNMGASV